MSNVPENEYFDLGEAIAWSLVRTPSFLRLIFLNAQKIKESHIEADGNGCLDTDRTDHGTTDAGADGHEIVGREHDGDLSALRTGSADLGQ